MRRTDSPDDTRSYFRSAERVFMLNGQWFFDTREGDIGPFVTREEALSEVARFVRERHDLDLFQSLREQHAERIAALPFKPRSGPSEPSRRPLALVPKEETEMVVGNLALDHSY